MYIYSVVSSYEFGGPCGVLSMMIGFPILMYYFWMCMKFNDGHFLYPKSVEEIKPFFISLWDLLRVVSFNREKKIN